MKGVRRCIHCGERIVADGDDNRIIRHNPLKQSHHTILIWCTACFNKHILPTLRKVYDESLMTNLVNIENYR